MITVKKEISSLSKMFDEIISECLELYKKIRPIETIYDYHVNIYFGFPDGSISEYNFDLQTYKKYFDGR
jgi:hypothetical protein